MTVHFCGPCLATSLIKYSSSCSVQARFRPMCSNPYTLIPPLHYTQSPPGFVYPEGDFLRASPDYSTSIIINYCQTPAHPIVPPMPTTSWILED